MQLLNCPFRAKLDISGLELDKNMELCVSIGSLRFRYRQSNIISSIITVYYRLYNALK